MRPTRRALLAGLIGLPLAPQVLHAAFLPWPLALVQAARAQIGVTTLYDPGYVRLDYPMGDLPRERGVCVDVVIRAYRDAFGFDFQRAVHEDMQSHFGDYPRLWGLSRPDASIDHRRVPNVETWLERHGAACDDTDWQAGDVMTCRLVGNLAHIGIVSDRRHTSGRPLVIHNIGAGTQEEDLIGRFFQERRFRFAPPPASA